MENTPNYSNNSKPRKNILAELAEELEINNSSEDELFEVSKQTPIIERPQAEPQPSSSKGMFIL